MLGSLSRFRVATALLLALALAVPAIAHADGDPGSAVLVAQNLFVRTSDGVSAAQQVQLGKLLNATAAAGAPVRVAIIGRRQDLGGSGALWERPASYARHLAASLADSYQGRVLAVMPGGVGVYWWAHRASVPALTHAISTVHAGGASGSALVAATTAAVEKIEAAAGISSSKLASLTAAAGTGSSQSASTSSAGAGAATGGARTSAGSAHPGRSSHTMPGAALAVILVLALLAYVAFRRGWRPRLSARRGTGAAAVATADGEPRRVRIRPAALLPTALLVIVVVALVINQSGSSSASSAQPAGGLATNPQLDPGSTLPARPAPNFTLYNQRGQRVSLSQFRGKVVIMSFIDAECQTICPLTTEAMLDAKRALGPAAKDVQLLGVNANWKSTQIADVQNFTQMHGMTGQWQFLTGTPQQLGHVWSQYKINETSLLSPTTNVIDHVAATYIVDPQGRLRKVYTTQMAYAAIHQFGQLLAHEASSLLPSHPKVESHYSYKQVKGIAPTQTTKLPRVGGGTVTLGPGKPHLYLFFATWDRQSTSIGAGLAKMNTYDSYARAHGLPGLTAIDEGSVEPSPSALPDFLKTLPRAPSYPVVVDQSGKVADGYNVQGEPWFVLTDAAGRIVWYQEVYTSGWPSLSTLEREVHAALTKVKGSAKLSAAQQALAGSPTPLAALHAEASSLLSGGMTALETEMTRLEGYPKVINVWGSWCPPCQQEFPLFERASVEFGKRVAFLGADYHDNPANARQFLKQHTVYYPSYQAAPGSINRLLPQGLLGTPETIFIGPSGKVLYTHIGEYQTQGTLDSDIEHYALHQSGG